MEKNNNRGVLVIGLIVLVLLGNIFKPEKKPELVLQGQVASPVPAKVDTSTLPISYADYEYSLEQKGSGMCDEYTVLAKIDPAKDDYKAKCRYIIRNISRKWGNHVLISIYDNRKAYDLKVTQSDWSDLRPGDTRETVQGRIKRNLAYMDAHRSASYGGEIGGAATEEDNYQVYYYEGNNKYHGSEKFRP